MLYMRAHTDVHATFVTKVTNAPPSPSLCPPFPLWLALFAIVSTSCCMKFLPTFPGPACAIPSRQVESWAVSRGAGRHKGR